MRKTRIARLSGRMLILCLLLTSNQVLSQPVIFSIPDTSAASNSLLKLPIRTTNVTGLGIISMSITITFNPNVLDALGANSIGTISQSWGNPMTSDSTGQMKLIMAGTSPLAGEGVLTYLFFEVTGAKDDSTTIWIKSVKINDGAIIAKTVSGKFTALEAEPSPHIRLAMPDTSGTSGSIIDLPIRVSDLTGFNIDSLRLQLTFNKYVLQAQDVITTGTLTEGWKDSIESLLPGSIALFLTGSQPLADSGKLCLIRFKLKGSAGMATPIHFQNLNFFNDTLKVATRNGKITISGGTTSAVMVSIPDISADSASTVTIPVFISDVTNKQVWSVALKLVFNSKVLQYQRYSTTNTLMNGWSTMVKMVTDTQGSSQDTLILAGFAAQALVGQGILVEFEFKVIGKPSMQSALIFSKMELNEGEPSVTAFGGIFTVNYVIPVELMSFNACLKGKQIFLTWATASESDNYGFEIERSINFKDWQRIGFVPGHGTTTIPQLYSFTDKLIDAGTYWYRLRQIDLNGDFEYSRIVEVIVAAPQKFSLGQNYPNPFNPTTSIPFDLPEQSNIKLALYNLLGEMVAVIASGEYSAGHHQILFSGEKLAAGLYFYKLEAKDFVSVKKLLILK